MIPVTKPYLPSISKIKGEIDNVWQSGILTNHGQLIQNLEIRLKNYLNVDFIQIQANGTLSLQLAIRALGLKGKMLTTPYSYVATTSSILWENCEPIFIDISEEDFNVNSSLIEKALNEHEVCGMLFTHVYGIPCDVDEIDKIAAKYSIPVIYDAAHAFGVKVAEKSVLRYGNISTLSFHATKIFHMVEGGAVIFNDKSLEEKLFLLKSFGHRGDHYYQLGINAKNSELHAVVGHAVLDDIETIMKKRKEQWVYYLSALGGKSKLKTINLNNSIQYNYSYFPVVFESNDSMSKVQSILNDNEIFPRRYFYPSLNKLPYIDAGVCKVSESIADRVLCLPLYHLLSNESQTKIINIILRTL